MNIYILLTEAMKPVPESIKHNIFGKETIVNIETGDLLAIGESAYIEGTEEDVIKWLVQFDGLWITDCPQTGPWKLVHIKEKS